jgi:hypothetical protein
MNMFGVPKYTVNRRRCLFIEKTRKGYDQEHKNAGKVPKTVNGETVASQWLRAELQRY